ETSNHFLIKLDPSTLPISNVINTNLFLFRFRRDDVISRFVTIWISTIETNLLKKNRDNRVEKFVQICRNVSTTQKFVTTICTFENSKLSLIVFTFATTKRVYLVKLVNSNRSRNLSF